MQALTLAISPAGIELITKQLLVGMVTGQLSGITPQNVTAQPSDIQRFEPGAGTYYYSGVTISLTGGSVSNFSLAFQSLTQNANGQFTWLLAASNVTVNYATWHEVAQYTFTDIYGNSSPGHVDATFDNYALGIQDVTLTVPVTLGQEANSYTLQVGQVQVASSGYSPHIPNGSIMSYGPGEMESVDSATINSLETVDFQTPVGNAISNACLTIPASGELTPDIVFDFNAGDTPLAFPGNAGMSLGVTGNVTWQGNAYSGGTAPSLGIPSIPTSNDVHFYAADYEFSELFWAFYKDGRLNTTIIASQLTDPTLLWTNTYRDTTLGPLAQKYPGLWMTLEVTPHSPATVTFQNVYELVYGDNGVLTTLQMQLPVSIYTSLQSLQGSVYLTQAAYESALQSALGSNVDPNTRQQIEEASVVIGPFPQVYQVTQAGLNSLQQTLPSGVYSTLSAGLTVGQVFADKAWLLAAIENALGTLALTNQYAPDIEAAFAVQGSYPQVYWVTPGTNGGLSTLVERLPADVYNALAGLQNNVYLDQSGFVTDVENAIGSGAEQYMEQITSAAQTVGAIVTQTLLATVNVTKAGQTIPVFTVSVDETDLQQNFHLGIGSNNTQTVQFDFQLINSETTATLVSSNIPGINVMTFPTIWNIGMHTAYQNVMQSLGRAGVPLPFMAGLQFRFDEATVTVQPGYADVLTDVEFIGTPALVEALDREPRTVGPSSLPRQDTVAARATGPRREPARWGGASRVAGLARSGATAASTRLVRSTAAPGSSTSQKLVQEGI
jgi:hypothetical protein